MSPGDGSKRGVSTNLTRDSEAGSRARASRTHTGAPARVGAQGIPRPHPFNQRAHGLVFTRSPRHRMQLKFCVFIPSLNQPFPDKWPQPDFALVRGSATLALWAARQP